MLYIHNEILHKCMKKWTNALCNIVDGVGGYYTKWNKSVK